MFYKFQQQYTTKMRMWTSKFLYCKDPECSSFRGRLKSAVVNPNHDVWIIWDIHLHQSNGRLVFIEPYAGSVLNPMRTTLKMRNRIFTLFTDADRVCKSAHLAHTNEPIISIKMQEPFLFVVTANPERSIESLKFCPFFVLWFLRNAKVFHCLILDSCNCQWHN